MPEPLPAELAALLIPGALENDRVQVGIQSEISPLDGDGNGSAVCDIGAHEHFNGIDLIFQDGFQSRASARLHPPNTEMTMRDACHATRTVASSDQLE